MGELASFRPNLYLFTMEQPIIHTMFLHENILFSQHANFDITESKADPGSNFVLQSSKMEAGATGLPGPHVQ